MLIDLHTHTVHHSLDSALRVEELLTRAKAAGLEGVCLTEHNAMWDKSEAQELATRFGLAVFRGMEISTERGHVLAFGLDRFATEMLRLERLRVLVEEVRGALVLAHPQREPRLPSPLAELSQWFHAVEVLNGSDANRANGYLAGLAAHAGLPGTGGSDAHTLAAVGVCATRFESRIATEEELVRELRAGRCSAVQLRPAPTQSS